MKYLYKKIDSAFKSVGIQLPASVQGANSQFMPESITNQFLKVEDIHKNKYLIRVNGKLWPPFTREGESFNLFQLKLNRIQTNVIVNDCENGFQICSLENENTKLTKFHEGKKDPEVLKKIAQHIKKFHAVGDFANNYPLASTITSSLKRIPHEKQKTVSSYQRVILALLCTLHADKVHQVSSHNDLLPSSVYVKGDAITFVDWEYSAVNHRSYDLAFVSIKNCLKDREEDIFLFAYDPDNFDNLKYSVAMMKPIISYLLLLWNLSSQQTDLLQPRLLFDGFIHYLSDVTNKNAERLIRPELSLFLFSIRSPSIISIEPETLDQTNEVEELMSQGLQAS